VTALLPRPRPTCSTAFIIRHVLERSRPRVHPRAPSDDGAHRPPTGGVAHDFQQHAHRHHGSDRHAGRRRRRPPGLSRMARLNRRGGAGVGAPISPDTCLPLRAGSRCGRDRRTSTALLVNVEAIARPGARRAGLKRLGIDGRSVRARSTHLRKKEAHAALLNLAINAGTPCRAAAS